MSRVQARAEGCMRSSFDFWCNFTFIPSWFLSFWVHLSHRWLDTTIRLLECSIKHVRRSITCAPPLHCQWSYIPGRDRRAVVVGAELDAKASVEGTCEQNRRVVWMLKREWHWVSKEKQASWHTGAKPEWKNSGVQGEGSFSTYCPFANFQKSNYIWEYKYP